MTSSSSCSDARCTVFTLVLSSLRTAQLWHSVRRSAAERDGPGADVAGLAFSAAPPDETPVRVCRKERQGRADSALACKRAGAGGGSVVQYGAAPRFQEEAVREDEPVGRVCEHVLPRTMRRLRRIRWRKGAHIAHTRERGTQQLRQTAQPLGRALPDALLHATTHGPRHARTTCVRAGGAHTERLPPM